LFLKKLCLYNFFFNIYIYKNKYIYLRGKNNGSFFFKKKKIKINKTRKKKENEKVIAKKKNEKYLYYFELFCHNRYITSYYKKTEFLL
jgi:hypothetical protein